MGLSVSLKTFGKYLDQPEVINKINKSVPPILTILGGAYVVYDTVKEPKKHQKKLGKCHASGSS